MVLPRFPSIGLPVVVARPTQILVRTGTLRSVRLRSHANDEASVLVFGTVGTRFTHLVGCRLPFQLAVLGGVGTTELAAAVSTEGGLGMVPYGVDPPPTELGPSGVGFLIPYLPSLEVIEEAAGRVRVVEFFEGDPDESLVRAGHSGGALVSWQVGSAEEGRAAEAAGCDLVVAQGVEAGGHVRGKVSLDELLPATLAAVGVPVVADGRGRDCGEGGRAHSRRC